MQLPSKMQSGQNFKDTTVKTVNNLIEYLKTQRIVGDNKTVKITQASSGLLVSATLPNAQKGGGGKSSAIDHPFKLSILTNEDGSALLNISQARIIINGDQGRRVYFGYYQNDIGLPSPLENLPTTDGMYNVVGYLVYDDSTESGSLNSQGWKMGCVFSDYNSTTSMFTLSSGFYHFIIGTISVKVSDQGIPQYAVSRQLLFSSLDIQDNGIDRDLRGHFQKSTYPEDGSLIEQLIADKFVINAGYIYLDDVRCSVPKFTTSDISSQNVFCISYTINNTAVSIQTIPISQYMYFNVLTSTYLFPVCKIFESSISGVALQQYILSTPFFNANGKLLLCEDDKKAEKFLHDKIKYETLLKENLTDEQKQIYGDDTYIMGITTNIQKEKDENSQIINLQDKLYWDWTKISGYDKQKILQINSDKGELKFDNAYMSLTDKDDPTPDYFGSKIENGQFIYKKVDTENHKVVLWTRALKQGYNITMTDGYQNDDKEKPYVKLDCHKTIVKGEKGVKATVTNTDENHTHTYTVSFDSSILQNLIESKDNSVEINSSTSVDGSVQFDLSARKVSVNSADSNPDYLENKEFSQDQSIIFSVVGNRLSEKINPAYFRSQDNSVTFTVGNGFLDLSASGKIKVTDNDPTSGNLADKIVSENDSLLFNITQVQELNIQINNGYFTSTDDSIEIIDNNTSLDFKSNGKVKVTENDQAGYLQEKLDTANNSIKFTFVPDTAFIDIDPSYFISSDQSIEIIDNTTSIDFKSNGKVKVTANDTADYLSAKIDVDPSISSFITLDKQDDKILIKSAIQGSGILVVNNGAISLLQASGNAVLACKDGTLTWIPYADCDNACSQ